MAYTLADLANSIDAELVGEQTCVIENVASIRLAGKGDITFLSHPKYNKDLVSCQGSAVILQAQDLHLCPTNALVVADPYVAYAKIAAKFVRYQECSGCIHPSAVIDPSVNIQASAVIGANCTLEEGVSIGENVVIGPGCWVGPRSCIGDGSRLYANVSLYQDVCIGRDVIIHAGSVIGSDGFGLADDRGKWIKVPQFGKVLIGDEVEIGANCTIDRGALEDTVIATGVKIDNLVHIAHNVRIGEHSAIAGCTGIAGSTEIGKQCTIAGAVAISGHLKIPDNSHFTGMAMVTKSNKRAGVYSSGIPAEANRQWRRNVVRFRQLDKIEQRLKKVEAQLEK